MQISVNTQSSIRIEGEKTIYVDPFKIDKAIHDADLIFLTHAHYDHFSPEDIQKVMREDTLFVCPESMHRQVLDFGVPTDRLIAVNAGDCTTVSKLSVEVIAAYNTKKPFHPRENGWVGYVITLEDQRIFIAGDTNFIPEHKNVQCDIALVPIGGYYTMDAREAAFCINTIRPKVAVPTHYGSIVGYPKDGTIFEKCVQPPTEVVFKLAM